HPVGGRQGRDGHQTRQERGVPGRGADVGPIRQDGAGDVGRADDGVRPPQVRRDVARRQGLRGGGGDEFTVRGAAGERAGGLGQGGGQGRREAARGGGQRQGGRQRREGAVRLSDAKSGEEANHGYRATRYPGRPVSHTRQGRVDRREDRRVHGHGDA